MPCFLKAPSHYLNQWHPAQYNFTGKYAGKNIIYSFMFYFLWICQETMHVLVWGQLLYKSQAYLLPAAVISQVGDHIYLWWPTLELLCPCEDSGQWDNYEEGSIDLPRMHQVRDKRDRLDCLAKTHLISQDDTIGPKTKQKRWCKNLIKNSIQTRYVNGYYVL